MVAVLLRSARTARIEADTLPDILAGVLLFTLGFVMWIFKAMGAGGR